MNIFYGHGEVKRTQESGVALIVAMLLLMLVSGIAIAVLCKVMAEVKSQKSDTGNTVSYYGGEAGMEKLTSDLGSIFDSKSVPDWCDLVAIEANPPDLSSMGISFTQYQVTLQNGFRPTDCVLPPSSWSNRPITQGSNFGLQAHITPLFLSVTSQLASGGEVRMKRSIEIAEIPVFQFGVFSESSLSFFAGLDFDFDGRVQTNGNLYLAAGSGASLTLHSPVRAAGNVIRDAMANGKAPQSGTVWIPTGDPGCPSPNKCRALGPVEQSTSSGWLGLSTSTYNSMILSGVPALSLPFVKSGVKPIEIIRRGKDTDLPETKQSRLYQLAQIRVLFSDDPRQLPGGSSDPENVRLANIGPFLAGVQVSGVVGNTFFAEGSSAGPGGEADWFLPASLNPFNTLTPRGAPTISPATTPATWNLIDGWLRVEIRIDPAGTTYLPVTQEWLKLGFARGFNPVSAVNPNHVNPNAILLLQQEANRLPVIAPAETYTTGLVKDGVTRNYVSGAATRNNWYPINLYDTREGGYRDTDDGKCYTAGVMNVVEIDVNNLRRWLLGSIPGRGTQVESTSQSGYVLYWSDRRGMMYPDTGLYGYEDVVNQNGRLELGEDVEGTGILDNSGAKNLGLGFFPPNIGNPYSAVDCMKTARKNWVSGARHAVRLENGSRGNVPLMPDGKNGGFTLASENPAYILGDYNADPVFDLTATHSHSAVIADTVTFLSNDWQDLNMFNNPTTRGNRAVTKKAYYRLAVASGKSMNFSWSIATPPATGSNPYDFGTDGGVHNFLRYLEDWTNQTSNYVGSMVSLYYSTYGTGTYKCCNTVYNAPTRFYKFDQDFTDISKMPPGTPKLRDVVNLGFQQVFTDPTTDK